jgi:thiol-disulfide isomerase/thioredoxin
MLSLFPKVAMMIAVSACVAPGADLVPGDRMPDIKVRELSGKTVALASEAPVSVLIFVSTQCPVSNDYNQRMIALYKEFAPKGVNFLFVNANHTENDETVATHQRQAGFPFPVRKDDGNKVADLLGATVTPEAYVVNAEGKLVYHGAIDDARNQARVTQQALRAAMEETLADTPVKNARMKALGCTIKRVAKGS